MVTRLPMVAVSRQMCYSIAYLSTGEPDWSSPGNQILGEDFVVGSCVQDTLETLVKNLGYTWRRTLSMLIFIELESGVLVKSGCGEHESRYSWGPGHR